MGIKRKQRGSGLGEAMYEVDFIKARRLVKGQLEYLIKWKGFDDMTWQTRKFLEKSAKAALAAYSLSSWADVED